MVDFPPPVGPVTSTKPEGRTIHDASNSAGRPRSPSEGISVLIGRRTAPRRKERAKQVHPETIAVGSDVAAVEIERFQRRSALGPERLHFLGRKGRGVELRQLAVDAELRRPAGVEEKIRRAVLPGQDA